MGRFEGESCASYLLYYGGISSSDYARNLDGKRPVRSRRLNHLLLCPTDFTDLHRFRPVRSMNDADFSSSNTQKNLCKSVKSVGPLKFQLHEFCVKFIKKMHGNVGDYKYFATFALDYENMN